VNESTWAFAGSNYVGCTDKTQVRELGALAAESCDELWQGADQGSSTCQQTQIQLRRLRRLRAARFSGFRRLYVDREVRLATRLPLGIRDDNLRLLAVRHRGRPS
jgi:hypothetical protein